MLPNDPDRTNDTLTNATTALRDFPTPTLPPRLLEQTEHAFTHTHLARYRKTLLLAAASIVILLAGLSFLLLLERSTTRLAFADVVQTVRQTRTFTASIDGDNPNPSRILVKDGSFRFERADSIEVINPTSGKTLGLVLSKHLAYITATPKDTIDIYTRLRNFHEGSDTETALGERLIDGQKLLGFRVQFKPTKNADRELTWTYWINPTTKLPVQVEAGVTYFTHIRFDVPLEDSLFAIASPPGFTLTPTPPVAEVAWDRFKYIGQVVDMHGKPIPNVRVTATHIVLADEGIGYIGIVKTDQDGRFTIDRPRAGSGIGSDQLDDNPVRLEFEHPSFLYASLQDVHLLPPEQRLDLHIRLRDGKSLSGLVLDAAGKPVAGAAVETIYGKGEERNVEDRANYHKITVTDADGKFQLHGLATGIPTIHAFIDSPNHILTGQTMMDLRLPATDCGVTIRPLQLAANKTIHQLFGMKFVEVDPDIQSQLFLYHPHGLLLLDPGPDSTRLGLGKLFPGDSFFMVEDSEIKTFDQFVHEILVTCLPQSDRHLASFNVEVVYEFNHPEQSANNTQSLKLTPDDLAELQKTALTIQATSQPLTPPHNP